jgi:hypothetical protein
VENVISKLPDNGVERNRVGGVYVWDEASKTYQWKGGLQEGGHIGDLYAYRYLGVYATDDEAQKGPKDAINSKPRAGGDVRWLDTDGDGTITDKDRVYVGNIYPKWTGGFSNYVTYKSFGLAMRMDYMTGHTIYAAQKRSWDIAGSGNTNLTQDVIDKSWRKQGDIAEMPQFLFLDPKNNSARGSSYYYYKGNYLALREVTLSYTMPVKLANKMKLNNVRFNVTANNVRYFTGYDRTAGIINTDEGGTNNGRYPTSRDIIVGVSVTF